MRSFKRMLALLLVCAALAISNQVWAAACTCTLNGTSGSTTAQYGFLNCTISATACTVTDGMKASTGLSSAKHLEINDDCTSGSITLSMAFNGGTAVAGKGLVVTPGQHYVYDVSGNNPPPGTSTATGYIPPGTFSLIGSGSGTTCVNIGQW